MKKQFTLLMVGAMLALTTIKADAQMSLQHMYTGSNVDFIVASNDIDYPLQVVNLSLSGKKYCLQNLISSQVLLYNLDHTLWKTISVPAIAGYVPVTAYYISENLFKIDNKVDVAIDYFNNTSALSEQVIIDETGATINTVDSSNILQVFNIGTDSFIAVTSYPPGVTSSSNPFAEICKVYALPGSIPCNVCNNSSLGVQMPVNNGTGGTLLDAMPNPSSGNAKIYYTLPNFVNTGNITLYAQDGKMVNSYKVFNNTSNITISTSNLAAGMYYYTLIANGMNPVTKKLVVN